jgi:DNA-binding response OmpR family regulator
MTSVLLVVRDGDIRRLIRDMLARSEYTVLEAAGEQDALAATADGEIRLLIAEVSPVVDGPALVGSVRERTGDMPALYVTAWHDHPQLPPLGDDRVLKAPFTRDELLGAIGSAVVR